MPAFAGIFDYHQAAVCPDGEALVGAIAVWVQGALNRLVAMRP